MSPKFHAQHGQALVLIVFAIIGLLAMVGLAVDSSNAYADRRNAQGVADNAVLAAALAKVNDQRASDAVDAVLGGEYADVTIHDGSGFEGCDGQAIDPVNSTYPHDKADYYIQVIVRSSVDTYFGPIIGINQVNSCVQAIARGKPEVKVPPFYGNAVVGVAPSGNSFDSGNSNAAKWHIKGGGIFANSNAHSKNGDSVTFLDGECVTAVGTVSGFDCDASQGNSSLYYQYPDDIIPLMPPEPDCNGESYVGADGKIHPQSGAFGSNVDSFEGDYAPGLYCITDAGGNIHGAITGTNVTFYILDTDFTMRFNGGGYIGASAPTSGIYAGVLMFGPITDTPCTQDIEIRGNGSTPITGSIFMPSACIDYRGNGEGDATNSLFVGYRVTSNGSADVHISYNPDDNYKAPEPATVELTQ